MELINYALMRKTSEKIMLVALAGWLLMRGHKYSMWVVVNHGGCLPGVLLYGALNGTMGIPEK